MAFKRYIYRHGKKLGPYYYENTKGPDGKVKTVYLGTNPSHHPKHRVRKPLFFLIIVLVLILILGGSLFFLQNKAYLIKKVSLQEPDFDVDQILLKVLVRSNEFLEKQIRIMNTGNEPATINVEVLWLADIIKTDAASFTIKPGQTKILTLNFSSFIPEQKIEQQPGIYVGKLIVNSQKASKEVPIVVEIETKNVLFDMNLNPVAIERKVKQGSDTTIEVRLFNLESIDSVNVDVEYFVKDINGNTIITESETVVVKTQASFFKTISVPRNLKPGPYVFAAIVKFGNSIGTSSYLFEVTGPEVEASFVQLCKNSVLCLGLSLTTILLLFALTAYFYFFIGAYLYEKVTGIVTLPKKKEEESEAAEEAVERLNIFDKIRDRIDEWKKERELKKAEKEKEEELQRLAKTRKAQLDAKRGYLEEERGKQEELRKNLEEERKKQEALRKEGWLKKQRELEKQKAEQEERIGEEFEAKQRAEAKRKEKSEREKIWKERKEKAKEFLHKIGLYKTPEEKKQIVLQKEKERQERLRKEEQLKREKEKQRLAEENKREELKRQKELEQKRKEEEIRKAEEEKKIREEELKKQKEQQRLAEEKRLEQLRRQKELERQKAQEARRKLEEEQNRQRELERQKAEEEKRKIEEELRKQKEIEEKQRLEEQRRKQIGEEKRKQEELRRQEELRKQRELEKQKAEEEKLRREEEELKKKRLEEERKKQEELRRQEELKRQKELEKQRLEQIKAQKLESINQIKAKLNKNKETAELLNSKLSRIESERKPLLISISKIDAEATRIDDEILSKSKQSDELHLKRINLSEKYKKELAEFYKKQEAEKSAHELKIKELKAKLIAKRDALIKELGDELSKLSPDKRTATEKWKRLELKAKLKIEEHNLEDEIKKYLSKAADEKAKVEESHKKSLGGISRKRSELKQEIADLEGHKEQILREKGKLSEDLQNKNEKIQKTRLKLEFNAKEQEQLNAELSKLKAELSKFKLDFFSNLILTYRDKFEKIREEKKQQKAMLEEERRKQEEELKKQREEEEKLRKIEEEKKRKEEEKIVKEKQKRVKQEERLRLEEELKKQRELEAKRKEEERQRVLEEKRKVEEGKKRKREEGKRQKELEKQKAEEAKKKLEEELEEKSIKVIEEKKPEKKVKWFISLFKKEKPEIAEIPEKLEEEEPIQEKPVIFTKTVKVEEKGKKEKKEKPLEFKKPKSEVEELEEAIRNLGLFKKIETGKIKPTEKLLREPGIVEKLIEKGKQAMAPKEEIEGQKPEARESVFKRLFGKKEAEEEEKEAIEQPELIGKSRQFEKCYNALNKVKEAIANGNIPKAKKIYVEAREIYIGLEDGEKKDIYDELMELYNKLR